jgi:hypothetical protein
MGICQEVKAETYYKEIKFEIEGSQIYIPRGLCGRANRRLYRIIETFPCARGWGPKKEKAT